jgi:hypothetical protein
MVGQRRLSESILDNSVEGREETTKHAEGTKEREVGAERFRSADQNWRDRSQFYDDVSSWIENDLK